MLVRAPIRIAPWSPRSTADGQTDASSPTVTSPISVAAGWMKAAGWIWGTKRSNGSIATWLIYADHARVDRRRVPGIPAADPAGPGADRGVPPRAQGGRAGRSGSGEIGR